MGRGPSLASSCKAGARCEHGGGCQLLLGGREVKRETDVEGEFSARYKAGSWAARIQTQDLVAAVCAVEAIGGSLELVPPNILELDGRIFFEAREDFELRWRGGRQYVSVKDRQVDPAGLKHAITDLQQFAREVGPETYQTLRLETASLTRAARSLNEDIMRLRELRESVPGAEDHQAVFDDFERQHGISAEWAIRVVVMERRLGDNPQVANAIFSDAMRRALPVHNYGNEELVALLADLSSNILAKKRQRRGALDLSDLERLLLAPLIPMALAAYETHYLRTDFGYLPDREYETTIKKERILVLRAARTLARNWRRATFWTRFLNFAVRGAVKCLACNHPMIGNFNGRFGLVCPDCGYQPYLTLFWACDCGGIAVVERQPDVVNFVLIRDAVNLLRQGDITCEDCGKVPAQEHFIARLFTLRIPHPPTEYTDKSLMNWREELGWDGGQWDPNGTLARNAREEMIRRNNRQIEQQELTHPPEGMSAAERVLGVHRSIESRNQSPREKVYTPWARAALMSATGSILVGLAFFPQSWLLLGIVSGVGLIACTMPGWAQSRFIANAEDRWIASQSQKYEDEQRERAKHEEELRFKAEHISRFTRLTTDIGCLGFLATSAALVGLAIARIKTNGFLSLILFIALLLFFFLAWRPFSFSRKLGNLAKEPRGGIRVVTLRELAESIEEWPYRYIALLACCILVALSAMFIA